MILLNIFKLSFHQEIYNEITKFCDAAPHPSRYWLGTILVVFVSSPEDMKTILNSPHCIQKPYMYEYLGVKNGLMVANGSGDIIYKTIHIRKIIAFCSTSLENNEETSEPHF